MNSEAVFYEILLLQGTTASQQLLKVQHLSLSLSLSLHPPPPQHFTHHYSCKKKLISCTIKNFIGGSVLKERKISVPKELIAK